MYKKAWCMCKVVVLLIEPFFFTFSLPSASLDLKVPIRKLKQQRRRRLRKRHLKSEFVLIPPRLIRQMLANFLELNSKRQYRSSGKEKQSRRLVFTSSTKREIRQFHVVVVQWRQRNVQKSVMHVQSCFFANLNLLLFCRSRCRRRRLCLSSLLGEEGTA